MVGVSILSLRTGSVNVTWRRERVAYALCLVGSLTASLYYYVMCAAMTSELAAGIGAFVEAGQVGSDVHLRAVDYVIASKPV